MPLSPCPPDHILLPALSGEKIDPENKEHLASCPACQARMERLRSALSDLRKVAALPILSSPTAGGPASGNLGVGGETHSLHSAGKEPPLDEIRTPGYRILKKIGSGGMGVVYKAVQDSLNRVVALKILAPRVSKDSAFVKRFVREAKAMAQLTHPHIVQVFMLQVDEEPFFFAMEYIQGPSLDQVIKGEGFVACRRAVAIALQVAEALGHAHGKGIVHRDVKPSNILLEDHLDRVKVSDFGIAKLLAEDSCLTRTGETVGTPYYMSPEQVGGRDVGPQTDVYSLGVVVYEMLTGRVPFRADTPAGVVRQIEDKAPRPIREFNPEVPDGLASVVEKALAKSPYHRHKDMAVFAEALAPFSEPPGPFGQRRRSIGFIPNGRRFAGPLKFVGTILILVPLLWLTAIIAFKNKTNVTPPEPTVTSEQIKLPSGSATGHSGPVGPPPILPTPPEVIKVIAGVDGRIAFVSRRDGNAEIYAIKGNGTGQNRLTSNDAEDLRPDFSKDGSRIVFASNRDGNFEIYLMKADGADQKRLTSSSASDDNPSLSPDGNQVAFQSNRDGDPEICLINVDGSGLFQLTNNAAEDMWPHFSPDSKRILFVSNRDGNLEIYTMKPDGTDQARLTKTPTNEYDPVFNPAGTKIAFHSDRDVPGQPDIYVMNADGTASTRLTKNTARNYEPTFRSDGGKVAFSTNRDGDFEIYTMNSDGTGEAQRLTNAPGSDGEPTWGRAD